MLILKMHQNASHSGGSPEYWERTWSDASFDEALRFCQIDPLRALFERCVPPGSRMLEGGCGLGCYVAYYGARGARTVGLDFAVNSLARLRQRDERAALCAGDVAALPFRDETFEVYYSGGVVEHFEEGCGEALRECRRVLRPSGVLLISVPYFSPLRRALSWVYREWTPVLAPATAPPPRDGVVFFQYAYPRRAFERMLQDAGFRLRSVRPYSIVWGLFEAPLVKAAAGALRRRRGPRDPVGARDAPTGTSRPRDATNHGAPSLLKRLLISEDTSVPVAGAFMRGAGWLFANMLMFECVRDD